MNIKLASNEDLTISTKSGGVVTIPDATGTLYMKPSGGITSGDIASGVIPSPVQADWGQTNTGASDYIKNKPYVEEIWICTEIDTTPFNNGTDYAMELPILGQWPVNNDLNDSIRDRVINGTYDKVRIIYTNIVTENSGGGVYKNSLNKYIEWKIVCVPYADGKTYVRLAQIINTNPPVTYGYFDNTNL